ncbi:MAG: dihydroorotate dehydrogenase electron transfer subunit [Eubacteriaceae bacterium]|nr:dihydroorotate dehydrogenase electron transfer subunit [Eubacteriaceae bacterium]
MALVLENIRISTNMYLMTTDHSGPCRMGQFYMVRGWDKYPLLSRPISIFDRDDEGTKFLYRVVGEGTKILSQMKPGDEIDLQGPYGNGFPETNEQEITLIGGGIGTAPLYFAAKELKRKNPDINIKMYLGFEGEDKAAEVFSDLDAEIIVKTSGYITDWVDYENEKLIFTCGPEIMMETVCKKAEPFKSKVYVSMEKRMACGVGACLGCTCATKEGNKRTCKEGPVFKGGDVFYEQA